MRPTSRIIILFTVLGVLTLTLFQIFTLMSQKLSLLTEETDAYSLSFLPNFDRRVAPERRVAHTRNATTGPPRELLKPSNEDGNNHLHQPISTSENATPRTTTTTTTTSMNNSSTVPNTFPLSHHPNDNNINNNNNNNTANEPLTSSLERLPQWIQNYVAWHNEMRAKFPGSTLMTDPRAPKLLVRTCFAKCGGLHDRLGKLPWDLYLANQTNRILLLHWCVPAPLETFLNPHYLDWKVPPGLLNYNHSSKNYKKTCANSVQTIRTFFEGPGGSEKRPDADFWNRRLDAAIVRANNNDTDFGNAKILRHEILGMDLELSKRLRALNETDMLSTEPSFGSIFFDVFFQFSPGLQVELNQVMQQLPQLQVGQYSAAHCRVRHPKIYPRGTRGKVKKSGGADKWGLLFEGMEKDFAVATATTAIQCAQKHLQQANEPIYFYADSEDLVRYMPTLLSLYHPSSLSLSQGQNDSNHNHTPSFLPSSLPVDHRTTSTTTTMTAPAGTNATHHYPHTVHLVTRTIAGENLHIDRQEADDPTQFYGSFIDLWIAAHARCVAFGVGNFAYFAYKLSGASCGFRYQEEKWESDGGDKVSHSTLC